MISRRSWLVVVVVALLACHATAYIEKTVVSEVSVANMTVAEVEDALQVRRAETQSSSPWISATETMLVLVLFNKHGHRIVFIGSSIDLLP